MKDVLMWILAAVIGYGLGCISTGVIVSKAYAKIDIRKYGSGNAGMTNVMRTLGWFPGFLSFAGDMLKGLLAAFIGKWLGGEVGMCVGGIFAVIGHNWPVFLGFKGGKGISTSFGFILASDWRIALILLAVQLVVLLSTGFMSLASIISSITFFVCAVLFDHSVVYMVAAFIAMALSLYSHRANIKRLLKKEENRLNFRKISERSKRVNDHIKDRKKDEK